jgi:hypothetical protein
MQPELLPTEQTLDKNHNYLPYNVLPYQTLIWKQLQNLLRHIPEHRPNTVKLAF